MLRRQKQYYTSFRREYDPPCVHPILRASWHLIKQTKVKCFSPHLPCEISEAIFFGNVSGFLQILVDFQSISIDFLSFSITFSQFLSVSVSSLLTFSLLISEDFLVFLSFQANVVFLYSPSNVLKILRSLGNREQARIPH